MFQMTWMGKTTLKFRLLFGTGFLILAICVIQAGVLLTQFANAMRNDAADLQFISLSVLVDEFSDQYGDMSVDFTPDGHVAKVTWDKIPETVEADVVDSVGRISGEAATIFRWDDAKGDFVRLMTNIKKPDGTRAVGTDLGKENPVRAAVLKGETYRGTAEILGISYQTIYQPIFDKAGKIIGIFFVGVENTVIDQTIAEVQITSVGVSAVMLLVSLALLFLLMRSQFRPLADVGQAFDTMARGDLSQSIPHATKLDEIGAIAARADAFRQQLEVSRLQEAEGRRRQEEEAKVVQALRQGLSRLAAGDLTQSLTDPFPSQYEGVREDFNVTLDTLNDLIGNLAQSSSEIRGRTDEISGASQDLSARTERQAATLEESAAALDELTESVRASATGASEVEAVVKKALSEVEQSGLVVQDAVGAMSHIKNSSDEIGKIIGVIDDIAFQTNLLALNAGVEAARAGEVGRGFAVVASEVRALAQRASEAAREIKALIARSSDQVLSGVALVNRTGDALTGIFSKVGDIARLVEDIARGAKEQSASLSEVNIGVSQLDQVTQQNAAMVEEVTATSATLKSDTDELAQMVTRFRVKRSLPEPARGRRPMVESPAPMPAVSMSAPRPAKAASGNWTEF